MSGELNPNGSVSICLRCRLRLCQRRFIRLALHLSANFSEDITLHVLAEGSFEGC